jgi:EmrB/QacA subfamily drug resistance transporter
VLLGGVIVQAISWRWVFFINVPIGAVALALTARIVPESRSAAAADRGYDVGGAIAITLGTMALVFTLIKADTWGWGSGKTIAGFAIAAVLIAAFLVIENRHPDPLVPPRIFSNRSLAASDVTMLLVAAALFGMFYFCTLYLQQVLGFSALKTGVSYLPFSLTLVVSSGAASRVVDRFTPKPVLVTGLLITTAGFIVLTQASGHGDYASHVLPALVILGIGLGMSFVPITIAATTGVAPEDSGLASGLLNTTQQVGGSLGLAILSTVATTRINDALHGGAALPAALTHGFKGGFTAAAIICAAGAVVALALLPRRKRDVENEDVETIAISFARCPGAPYCGYLARLVALGRRVRRRSAARS